MSRFLIIVLSAFSLFFLGTREGFSQNTTKTDSLKRAFAQEADARKKLKTCLELVNEVSDYDSLATVQYGNAGLALAAKLNDKRTAALLHLQSGVMYTYTGNEKTALMHFQRALQDAALARDTMISADIYNSLSNLYQATGQYALRDQNLQKALVIYQKKGTPEDVSMIYANMGANYNQSGDYVQAVNWLLKALKIREQIHYDTGVANVAFNITHAYMKLNQFDEALRYNALAIEKYRMLKNEGMLGNAYTVRASVLRHKGEQPEATRYYQLALPLLQRYNNTAGLRSAYDGLGLQALAQKRFVEAIGYFTRSRQYSKGDQHIQGIVSSDINLAQAALDSRQYASALFYIREAEPLAKQYTFKSDLLEIYKLKIQYYTVRHQPEAANRSFNAYEQLRDSISGEAVQAKVLELQTRFETEKKDSQIKLLTKQSRIQRLQLDNRALQVKQRNLLIGLVFAVALALGIGAYARVKRIRQQAALSLHEAVFKQKEVAARALFDGEQQERIRVARDLHDSIGQMLAVVRMNVSGLQEQQPENAQLAATLRLVDDTIAEVRNISHNLIPEELHFGLFTAMAALCDKINSAQHTRVALLIDEQVKSHRFEQANALSIYRIVQEVLSNMMRHAQATLIEMEIKAAPGRMVIHIKDNGKGFDTTQVNDSKGLGWKNISARVNMLDGQLAVFSEQLIGTRIEIAIPSV